MSESEQRFSCKFSFFCYSNSEQRNSQSIYRIFKCARKKNIQLIQTLHRIQIDNIKKNVGSNSVFAHGFRLWRTKANEWWCREKSFEHSVSLLYFKFDCQTLNMYGSSVVGKWCNSRAPRFIHLFVRYFCNGIRANVQIGMDTFNGIRVYLGCMREPVIRRVCERNIFTWLRWTMK